MKTIVVIPFTSKPKGYPFRIATNHNITTGELCFYRIKIFDKSRIVKTKGTIEKQLRTTINNLLPDF